MRQINRPKKIAAAFIVTGCLLLVLLGLSNPSVKAVDTISDTVCESLSYSLSDDKNHYVFTATASPGDSATITGYKFDFGDHQSYSFTFAEKDARDRTTATVNHTYLVPGDFMARVTVQTEVDGKPGSASSDDCTVKVPIATPPGTMPDTGSGNIIGLFLAAAVLGAAAYQFRLRLWLAPREEIDN